MADKELSRKVITDLIRRDGRLLTEIADDIGISRQRLGQYQNGKRFPDADFIQKWQKKFGQNIMDLIEKAAGQETNVSQKTEKHTSVQNEAAVKENSTDPRQAIYEELYEKFLGTNSEYLVIHRDVLKNHRIVAVETLEKERKQAENAQQEIAERIKQIDKLTDMNGKLADLIGVASSRPINIQLAQPEKT